MGRGSTPINADLLVTLEPKMYLVLTPTQNSTVDNISQYVAVFHDKGSIASAGVHSHSHKAPLDTKEAVIAGILAAARRHGMGVAGRPAAELLDPVFRVNRMVLPVAIAVHENNRAIHILLQPAAKLPAFGREGRICVVVVLARVVRPNNGIGVDEKFPARCTRRERILKPAPLHITPDRLAGTVRRGVRRAIVARLR